MIILQGIDAAGKDGTIKHVMSGVNPAGCKWFTRVAVSDIIVAKLESMNLRYRKLDSSQKEALDRARKILKNEN